MVNALKRLLVGAPLPSWQAANERLTKTVALAVLSSDALSSVAYATEEILMVLAVAATYLQSDHPFFYVLPISAVIAVLLWLVTFSYRQTIYAYPSGGGAYIVAKENLGTYPGLTAAAALLVDYILTVSVSVAAGVAAITSAAQGTSLAGLVEHRTTLCIVVIALITIANLRGIRQSGALFAVPTYIFVVTMLGTIAWGLIRYLLDPATATVGEIANPTFAEGYAPQPLSLFLLLAAFANGCTAMTGVEAISNGVPAFRDPPSKNAATTLLWMATLLTVMFLGTSGLAYLYHARPSADQTIISEFARVIFADPRLAWAYYLVQGSTALILVLAANTSFADFPRLASLLARDGFMPQQFRNLGDRLVFSNGIILLAVFAGLLVWVFRGDTSRLIPLYAVGVFLSFTLSQAGMVRHWWRKGKGREVHPTDHPPADRQSPATAMPDGEAESVRGWRKSMVINGLGAVATALVLVVFLATKFVHGAWVVAVVIPLQVLLFRSIHRYYRRVGRKLKLGKVPPLVPTHNTVLIPVTRVHRGLVKVLEYAMGLSDDVHAVYVEIDPAETPQMQQDWQQLHTEIPLEVLPSPFRSFVATMTEYINELDAKRKDDVLTVILPEFVPAHWWQEFLHNQPTFLLRAALLYRPGIVVTSVPYYLK